MRTRHNSGRGFSMIEVLIALVILSTGMLALAALQVSLTRESALAKTRSLGVAVAQAQLDNLRANAFAEEDGSGYDADIATVTETYDDLVDELEDLGFGGLPTDTAELQRFLGGFSRTTTVTRVIRSNDAVACGDAGTPCFRDADVGDAVSPSQPEFKRVDVEVSWTDATGAAQAVTLTDIIQNVYAANSTKLAEDPFDIGTAEGPQVRIKIPDEAGVIPIAVSDGSQESAASNPKPIIYDRGQTDKTTFTVLTYAPEGDGATTATLTRKVDVAVVGCRCLSKGTAGTTFFDEPRGVTYWNGSEYVVPEAPSGTLRGYPDPDANQDQDLCLTCCIDHHDYAGTDPKVDPYRDPDDFADSKDHNHYAVSIDGTTLDWDPIDDDQVAYNEVCRMIRVSGFWTVAPDPYLLQMSLLETDLTESRTNNFGVPAADAVTSYQKFAREVIKDRFLVSDALRSDANEHDPLAEGNAIEPNYTDILPDEQIVAETKDTDYYYLHNRGLYVDYLEQDAKDKLTDAIANCSSADVFDCVLPFLPIVSINTTDIAQWESQADVDSITVSNLARNIDCSVPDFEGNDCPKGKDPGTGNRGIVDQKAAGTEAALVSMYRSSSGIADVYAIDPQDGADVGFEDQRSGDTQTFCVDDCGSGGGGSGKLELAPAGDSGDSGKVDVTLSSSDSGANTIALSFTVEVGDANPAPKTTDLKFTLIAPDGSESTLSSPTITTVNSDPLVFTVSASVGIEAPDATDTAWTLLVTNLAGKDRTVAVSDIVANPGTKFTVVVASSASNFVFNAVAVNYIDSNENSKICTGVSVTSTNRTYECLLDAGTSRSGLKVKISAFNNSTQSSSSSTVCGGGTTKVKANICRSYTVSSPASGITYDGVTARINRTATYDLPEITGAATYTFTFVAASPATVTRPIIDSDASAACSSYACTCEGTDGSSSNSAIVAGCGN